MTIDGSIAVIGTTNFDIRSFELHDELSIVFYDEDVAADSGRDLRGGSRERRPSTPSPTPPRSAGSQRMRNALARLSSRVL